MSVIIFKIIVLRQQNVVGQLTIEQAHFDFVIQNQLELMLSCVSVAPI